MRLFGGEMGGDAVSNLRRPVVGVLSLVRWAAYRQVAVLIVAVVLVILVALLDHATGYKLRFAALYLIPIAFATWSMGAREGMLIVALSCLSWLASFSASNPYPSSLYLYWEGGVLAVVYLAFVALLARLRMAMRNADDANRRLRQEMQERERAEAEIHCLNESLEERVAHRTRELTHANQNLERFSYSVAHDLRAPLRALHGYACILEESLCEPGSGTQQDYLDRIKDNAIRMGDLIDDILRFSRLSRTAMHIQRVDMEVLARRSLTDLGSLYPNAQVRIAPLPAADVDPTLMECVFENLIGNALKFSGTREEPLVEVGAEYTPEGKTVYFVRDNGLGFDMEHTRRLFEPFVRLHTSEAFPGTGVGLTIVKNVIERHHGRVWAQAKLNQGARFSFTLGMLGRGPEGRNANSSAEQRCWESGLCHRMLGVEVASRRIRADVFQVPASATDWSPAALHGSTTLPL